MTKPRSLYSFWSNRPPSGSRSGNDTLAEFFSDERPASKIDLERWIAIILGNFVIRICLAILRLGANLKSGNSTSLGGCSGSDSIASLRLSMASCVIFLNFSEVDLRISCWNISTAWTNRHFSHLKSSIYSVLNIPSKQVFNVVELTCGTLRVKVQNVELLGLGLNPQVKHSICDSNFPSKGKPSSSSYAVSVPSGFCICGGGSGLDSPLEAGKPFEEDIWIGGLEWSLLTASRLNC